jgi:hypothetical protein
MQYDTLGNLFYVQNLMDTPNDTSDDICELYSYNIASLRVEGQCRQRYNGNEAITTYIDYNGKDYETSYTYDSRGNRVIEKGQKGEIRKVYLDKEGISKFTQIDKGAVTMTIKDFDGDLTNNTRSDERYNRFVKIPIDPANGYKAYKRAEEIYNNPGEFKGIRHNCNDVALEQLYIADPESNFGMPNWSYDEGAKWAKKQGYLYGNIENLVP